MNRMRMSKEQAVAPEAEARRNAESKETQEAQRHERAGLRAVIDCEELDPATALEIVATYDHEDAADPGRLEDLRAVAGDFGLELDALDPATRHELITLYAATDRVTTEGGKAEVARAMHEVMKEKLMAAAFERVDGLGEAVFGSRDVEEFKARYREVMRTLTDLARQMPPEVGADDKTWMGLYGRMRKAIELKNEKGLDPIAVEAIREVAAEFEGEIEDEFVNREIERYRAADKPHSVEHLMMKIYGRTEEEVEALKARNRAEVAAEILRLKDDPQVSIATLEKLHALNNRGIVPKAFSRLRNEQEGMVFGKRIGLHAEDARAEVEAMLARAEALIGREIVHGVPGPVYEIAAAKLHNDLLDLHPFPDRNGSTAMLFLELLMSKKGYVPEQGRPDSYYGHLRETLGSNPVAIGVVAYEHYKIRHQAGYYEGETVRNDPEKKKFYDQASEEHAEEVMALRARNKRREAAEKRAAKPGKRAKKP